MASSQLFPGLMVVPWFNKAEWKTVKEAVCSGTANNQFIFDRLQIWKQRTPILPSGVQCTLDIIQAFMVDLNDSIPDQSRLILKSSAIMRFLNLCVTGRSRQGTFLKNAKEAGIPDYLISIRNAFAHGSGGNEYSEYVLDKGLEYCYEHIKENYWIPQDKLLHDYIHRNPDDAQLHVYCEINYLRCSDDDYKTLGDVFDKRPSLLQWCPFTQVKFDRDTKVDDYLNEIYDKLRVSVSTAKFPSLIFSGSSTEILQDTDDCPKKQITDKSLDDWKDLVYLYGNSTKSLLRLIEHLVKMVTKGWEHANTCALIGSVWLDEIFSSLLQAKTEEENRTDRLNLNVKNVDKVTENLKKLHGTILNRCQPCTINFIKSFLLLSDFPAVYIEWKPQLVVTRGKSLSKMPESLRKFEEDFVKNLPVLDFAESLDELELERPKDLVEVEIDSRWSRADSRMVGHLRRKNAQIHPYIYHDF